MISLGLRPASTSATRDVFALVAVGVEVVQRHVWIGDGRLFEIFVDAAATPLVLGLQLDGYPRAVVLFGPLDAVFVDGFRARVGRAGCRCPRRVR